MNVFSRALFTLNNLIVDNEQVRNQVLAKGALDLVVNRLRSTSQAEELSILEMAIFLRFMTASQPKLDSQCTEKVLTPMFLLLTTQSERILDEACKVITAITCYGREQVTQVFDKSLVERVFDLCDFLPSALHVISNIIVYGNEE